MNEYVPCPICNAPMEIEGEEMLYCNNTDCHLYCISPDEWDAINKAIEAARVGARKQALEEAARLAHEIGVQVGDAVASGALNGREAGTALAYVGMYRDAIRPRAQGGQG